MFKGVQMTANHALRIHINKHHHDGTASEHWLLSENRKIEQEETRHKHTNLTTCTLWVIISELDVLCSRKKEAPIAAVATMKINVGNIKTCGGSCGIECHYTGKVDRNGSGG